MKLPVEESEFIPRDILDIARWIRAGNPAAAVRFVDAFKSSVELLSRMPKIGRARPDLGAPETRSWRVNGFRNHLIFYESLPDRVRLLRVLHGARDLQAELGR
ncbi:MAG: type II toxin-antitoxin system RelE/ParE family toxin [Verrucomicrobia bacterium]|nr:type II toxin-antitoxin system RelE/ParE family toxin [Verrucomicrobiota bacterium]MDE3100499.1 type II toxin-antitoxin system RelE/ParE family toxin [Verrucomicrobiota bacterium]